MTLPNELWMPIDLFWAALVLEPAKKESDEFRRVCLSQTAQKRFGQFAVDVGKGLLLGEGSQRSDAEPRLDPLGLETLPADESG
jgi:hypothetical protein